MEKTPSQRTLAAITIGLAASFLAVTLLIGGLLWFLLPIQDCRGCQGIGTYEAIRCRNCGGDGRLTPQELYKWP